MGDFANSYWSWVKRNALIENFGKLSLKRGVFITVCKNRIFYPFPFLSDGKCKLIVQFERHNYAPKISYSFWQMSCGEVGRKWPKANIWNCSEPDSRVFLSLYWCRREEPSVQISEAGDLVDDADLWPSGSPHPVSKHDAKAKAGRTRVSVSLP